MKIYLDSCIVIYIVEKHPQYATAIEHLLQTHRADDFCYSPLVRWECLIQPLRNKDAALHARYNAFFNTQQRLNLSALVFDAAAQLRADHTTLKTPDAIHLAATLHYAYAEFWTNDNRLDQVAPGVVKQVVL